MNDWQLCRQIQYLIRARSWSGTATMIFARQSVLVSMRRPEDCAGMRPPIALVRPLSASADPQHRQQPEIFRGQIAVTLLTAVAGDLFAEQPLLGGNRGSGADGRGLLEIQEEVLDAIGDLNDLEGVRIRFTVASLPEPQIIEGIGYALARSLAFEADMTADRYYHPCSQFTAAAAGGGVAALSWVLPPARFDRLGVILRRASGSTPPVSPTAGTGVTLSGDLATNANDNPGAGVVSYALFAAYDETGSLAAEKYSAAETQTVTVT